jgi:hypothetical protein
VPWNPPGCSIEIAENPSAAFPALEWTACADGPPGCEVLVKNWQPFTQTAQGIHAAQRDGDGHAIGLTAVINDGDTRSLLIAADGRASVAYRHLPSPCSVSRANFSAGGHWVGAQDVESESSRYVFQPAGEAPEAASTIPLTALSQRQAAGSDIFALEAVFAASVQVFDRVKGTTFTSPPALSSADPRVSDEGVIYRQANAVDDPTIWIWNRATGEFYELLSGGTGVVGEARASGGTLVWIESPQADPEDGFPPGSLYSSPMSTDPKALVPTLRWSGLDVPPYSYATIGGGYYAAVGESQRTIYVLRLSDGRRWEVPIPNDEFRSPIVSMAYIDETYLFLGTETQIHRIRIDALGEGLPPE